MNFSIQMKLTFLVAFFCMALPTNNAFAALETLTCNGCNFNQKESKASAYSQHSDDEYVIVFDFKNAAATKFELISHKGISRNSKSLISEVALTADEHHDVALILNFYKTVRSMIQSKSTSLFTESISETDYVGRPVDSKVSPVRDEAISEINVLGDPYTFMSRSSFRNDAFDYLMDADNDVFRRFTRQLTGAVARPDVNDMGLVIRINFYDEKRLMTYNGRINTFPDFVREKFIILSGRDADPVSYTHLTLPTNREV